MRRIGIVSIACALAVTVACDRSRDKPAADTRAESDRSIVGTGGADSLFGGGVEGFVKKAGEANMAEVQLGRVASERASNPDVKNFGQMMVRDHSKANDELKQAVSAHNVPLPTELDDKHRDKLEKLRQLQGADFDREYMRTMVDGHEEVADFVGDRASEASKPSGNDAHAALETAVNGWAARTLPAVQEHLRLAREISERLEQRGRNRTN